MGFAIQGGNLSGMDVSVATYAARSAATADSNTKTLQDAINSLNTAFYWVRGILGIVFIVMGILGMIWACFRKKTEEEEEAELAEAVERNA